MTKTSSITPEDLSEALRYDNATGKVFWLFRRDVNASVNSRCAGKEAFTYIHKEGYRVGTFKGVSLKAHRVAWALHYGAWPAGQIDHINGDRTDNRNENMRDVSPSENARNRGIRHDNTSGATGVCWDQREGRWLVQIMVRRRNKRVGSYGSLDEAIAARRDAERAYDYHENHGSRLSSRKRLSRAAQEKRE